LAQVNDTGPSGLVSVTLNEDDHTYYGKNNTAEQEGSVNN
jgi:hypothetical protein